LYEDNKLSIIHYTKHKTKNKKQKQNVQLCQNNPFEEIVVDKVLFCLKIFFLSKQLQGENYLFCFGLFFVDHIKYQDKSHPPHV